MAVAEEPEPCFTVTCDECGEHLGHDETGAYAYYHREEVEGEQLVRLLRDWDWQREDDRLLCNGCVEERADERREAFS